MGPLLEKKQGSSENGATSDVYNGSEFLIGFTHVYLCSFGLTLRFTLAHYGSLGFTWVIPRVIPWVHAGSFGFTHLASLCLTLFHLGSLKLSLGWFTRAHLGSLGFTPVQSGSAWLTLGFTLADSGSFPITLVHTGSLWLTIGFTQSHLN